MPRQIVIVGTPQATEVARRLLANIMNSGPGAPAAAPTPGGVSAGVPGALGASTPGMLGGNPTPGALGGSAAGGLLMGGATMAPQAEGTGQLSEVMPCPQAAVGRVIGRSGETIRNLQVQTGCRIQIDQNFPEGQPRQITITGVASAGGRAETRTAVTACPWVSLPAITPAPPLPPRPSC